MIFSDLLRSIQILKTEWGVESNGKLPHLSIPSKTAARGPDFAVEDLPEFAVKDLMMIMTFKLNSGLISQFLWEIHEIYNSM